MTCGRTCGTSYDFSSSSKDNRQLTEFKEYYNEGA